MKYLILNLWLLFSIPLECKTKPIRLKKISPLSSCPTVEISYGELIDKITILEIKTEKITNPKKLRNIWNELETLINTYYMYVPQMEKIEKLKEDLKRVNKKLWNIEDDIRAKDAANEFDDEFITLARAVYITNDERGRIKRKINDLCDSRLVEEKEYTKYNHAA